MPGLITCRKTMRLNDSFGLEKHRWHDTHSVESTVDQPHDTLPGEEA